MFCASAENIMFLVFTGEILDFKASLESKPVASFWSDCCCRRSNVQRQWYVRIWARIRSLDKSILNHYEEIEVFSQEFGSKVIKNFYNQIGSLRYDDSEEPTGPNKVGEALHLEYSDDEMIKED
jgi:hypothetical protein